MDENTTPTTEEKPQVDLWQAIGNKVEHDLAREAQEKSDQFVAQRREDYQQSLEMDSPADFRASPDTGDAVASLGVGAAKALFEAKDFLFGEPKRDDSKGILDYGYKSGMRNAIEDYSKELERRSPVNSVGRAIGEFGAGFTGLGVIPIISKTKKATGVARWLWDTGRAAATGAIFFDPHEERLSNVLEQFPTISTPITRYLAAKPEDSKAEGRLKAALESIGLDVAVAAPFVLSLKAMRFARQGDNKAALAVQKEADEAWIKSASEQMNLEREADTILRDGETAPKGNAGRAPNEIDPDDWVFHLDDVDADKRAAGEVATSESPRVAPEGAPAVDAPPSVSVDGNVPRSERATAGLEQVPHGEPIPRKGPTEPGFAPTAEVTQEQVEKSLARMRRDNAAIEAHGSMDEAIANGYKFQGQDGLPWQKLRTSDDVTAWVGQTMKDQEDFINKARGGNADGILTDKRVDAMVQQRARLFGEDPAALMGVLKQAGDNARTMAANMETAYLLANKAFQETYALAKRIELGIYGEYGSRVEALAALQHRMQISTELTASAKAMTASAGRTMRRMRSEFQVRAADLQKVSLDNIDKEELLKLITSTGGDTVAVSKVAKPSIALRIVDAAAGLQAANLLWSWKTQTINLASSVAMTAWRPLEKGLGASVQGSYAAIVGNKQMAAQARTVRTQARREVIALASTISDGWEAAKWAFMNGDSRLAPHTVEFTSDATGAGRVGASGPLPTWRPVKGINDVIYNALISVNPALHGSLRLMGAADEMVKTMRYRALIIAKASTDADEKGLTAGSRAYKDYVAQRVEDSFDEAGRALDADALAEARATTFQQDLVGAGEDTWTGRKSLGASLQHVAASNPEVRLILPFVKTPTNLFRYGIKLTPGLNLLQKEYYNAIRGLKGTDEQARAIGQMMLGTLLVGTAIQLRLNGQITGGGPVEPKKGREWRAQGNTPYSIVSTDEKGNKSFFQLNRFDPIQFPLTAIADFVDIAMQNHISEEEEASLAMSLLMTVSHQLKSKTYLKNISDFLEAVTDDRKGAKWLEQFAPGMIPFSTLFNSVKPDEYVREVHGVMDSVKARLPGFSDSVPPRRDFLGDKVEIPGSFYNDQKNSGPLSKALDEMYAMTGTYLEGPAPRHDGIDLRDVTLENGRNAFDAYAELAGHPPKGPSLKETLEKLVQTPTYKHAPHGSMQENSTKEWMISGVIHDYRKAAMDHLLATDKTFRELMYKRKLQVSQAAAAGQKDLKATAGAETMKTYTNLLSSYGVSLPR